MKFKTIAIASVNPQVRTAGISNLSQPKKNAIVEMIIL
jgi:hypothetical protein